MYWLIAKDNKMKSQFFTNLYIKHIVTSFIDHCMYLEQIVDPYELDNHIKSLNSSWSMKFVILPWHYWDLTT